MLKSCRRPADGSLFLRNWLDGDMMHCKLKQGFSLTELLITVLVVSVLAAIAIPNFKNAQIRVEVVKTYANFRSISYSLFHYQVDYGDLPPFNPIPGRSFFVLTSPIIYIADKELIMDPFAAKIINGDGFIVDNPNPFIWYYPFRGNYLFGFTEEEKKQLMSEPFSADVANTRINNPGFALFSVGPSQRYNALPYLQQNVFKLPSVYSPSNGIYSQGAIIAIDGKIYN